MGSLYLSIFTFRVSSHVADKHLKIFHYEHLPMQYSKRREREKKKKTSLKKKKRSLNIIRKTCPCNVYPLKLHFYIARKLGYAGVYLLFLFLLQNIDCGYSLGENFQFFKAKKSLFIAWTSFRNVLAQNIHLWEQVRTAVLTSTFNVCFRPEIRKLGIPLHTPFLLYKNGTQEGIYYTEMFSWWVA